jgi:hypothetical protein
MPILDILLKLFKGIKLGPLINIHIDNRKTEIHYDESNNTLHLGYPNHKEVIKELLSPAIDEGFAVLEQGTTEKLLAIKKSYEDASNKIILDFFSDKIPHSDLQIWRASLYLRDVYNSNGNVGTLKHDICTKYGDRGNNISNLCSAGYCESFIMPLYDYLKIQEGFVKEDFQNIYEQVVVDFPYALFINHRMREDEVIRVVKDKVETNLIYGFKSLKIHGISADNCTKIRKAIEFLETEGFKFEKREVMERPNVIVATLKFL